MNDTSVVKAPAIKVAIVHVSPRFSALSYAGISGQDLGVGHLRACGIEPTYSSTAHANDAHARRDLSRLLASLGSLLGLRTDRGGLSRARSRVHMDCLGRQRLTAFRADHDGVEHLLAGLVFMQHRPSARVTMWTLPQCTIDVMIG